MAHRGAYFWNVVLLVLAYGCSTVVGLWLVPSILDEGLISRTLLLVLVSVLMGVHFLFYVGSMVVHGRWVSVNTAFSAFYSFYYLGSLITGVLEVFLVAFFFRASADVDNLDESTILDPVNFTSLLVYQRIITILFGVWITRTFAFANAISNAVHEPNYILRRATVYKRRVY